MHRIWVLYQTSFKICAQSVDNLYAGTRQFWRHLESEMSPTLVREAHFWVKMSPILMGDNNSTDFDSWIPHWAHFSCKISSILSERYFEDIFFCHHFEDIFFSSIWWDLAGPNIVNWGYFFQSFHLLSERLYSISLRIINQFLSWSWPIYPLQGLLYPCPLYTQGTRACCPWSERR